MPLFDHLCISVDDLARGIAEFDPILTALGCARQDLDTGASWYREGETEFGVYAAREDGTGPHVHGRVGWQHLAFAVESRADVDTMHALALEHGWTSVRDPKDYPRFTDRYYASFLENSDGIRIEFMYNPPKAG